MDGLAWKVYLPPEDVNSQRLIEIFFFFQSTLKYSKLFWLIFVEYTDLGQAK